MWPVVGAAIVGALFARRGAPKTRITKSQVIGRKSGREWRTEYLSELGTMVVYGPRATVAFQRDADGWVGKRASGDQSEIAVIRKDFEG